MSAGTPTLSDFRSAAGNLLNEIASSICTAREVVRQGIGNGMMDADILVCLESLLEKTGALADRGSVACGGSGVCSMDDWTHAPGTLDALVTLDASSNAQAAAPALRVIDGQRPT
jgi:hypothetical protein